MRKFYTLTCFSICFSLICVGLSLTPSALAQTGTSRLFDEMAGGNISADDLARELEASLVGSATGEVQTTIEGQIVSTAVVPEINQTAAGTLIGDAQTGRYAPKLKINFSEFPLRSFEPKNEEQLQLANTEKNGRGDTTTNSIVQRIQSRLRIPQNEQVNLVVQDRTAIISGTVDTQRQRELIGTMLRFEPGIDVVKNELAVKD